MTSTSDRAAETRAIHAAHEAFLASGAISARIRDVVADSWRRSAQAGVDTEHANVPSHRADELRDYRDAHPLSLVFPLLYDVLGRAAEECDSVLAVGDAHGQLLWVCGRPALLAQAEQINFAEGAIWDEAHAGTNAPGTALAVDREVQIRAAEHFSRPVQPWSCAAAPIHDPTTRSILGLVDVTGGDDVGSPQTMAMVRAAARMAEAELGRLIATSPSGRLWRGTEQIHISALGRPDCQLEHGGRVRRLSPRHSELLVIVAEHPDGLSGEEVAVELYEGEVNLSTIRAEFTRLRALLGLDLLDSRPYRLTAPVACDWRVVERNLAAGRVADAVETYRGPLLPHSDAPGVVRRRDRLARQLRAAVLGSRDADLMTAWTRTRWGADDLDVWLRQVELRPAYSPLGELARAEVRRLNREFG